MLDYKFIAQNGELLADNCRKRNAKVNLDLVLDLIRQRNKLFPEIEGIRAQINKISESVKHAESPDEKEHLKAQSQHLKSELRVKEESLKNIEAQLKEEAYKIPNLTHPQTPIGQTDKDNLEIRIVGKIREFNFIPKDHVELGKALDIIDFEGGALTTGNKFYFLKKDAVLLELALIQYALEILIKEGFEPIITPDLAKLQVIEGIGYAPRGPEAQIYKIEKEDLGLIASAEITLGGLFQNSVIEIGKLPIKLAGLSHCFRTEAGTYGKASRGLYRVHQFTKLEMFIFSAPEESDKMLDHLVDVETKIFSGLEIPFRIIDCCTGDLGGPAYRKFDLEAWMPAENRWGEITSASNCTDYQARRINAKFKREPRGKSEFVHTLNATAIAISRALIAVLEHYQEQDGTVTVPQKLKKWIGKDRISF